MTVPIGGPNISRTDSTRRYARFRVPGATVYFRLRGFLKYKVDEICPVLDLSRGGMAFATNSRVKPGKKLSIFLECSDRDARIELRGQVVYCLPHPGMDYQYHIGFAFDPFAGKGSNSAGSWEALAEIEQLYGADGPSSS